MEPLTADAARALSHDAYLYAYPIVLMDATMRQTPATNAFMHARAFPSADARVVVRPNFDTLYSVAWLDVSREPVVLSVPEVRGRYYLMQMLDMWTDVFAAPGSRTTGSGPGHFAVAAPDWTGELPDGVELIRAPTSAVWVIGRTQTNGAADYPAVHRVQDAYMLSPLSRFGNYRARAMALDMSGGATPPPEEVKGLDGVTILARLAALLMKYPPHANDYPMLARLRALGIVPGKPFDISKFDSTIIAAINAGATDAYATLERSVTTMGQPLGEWSVSLENIGTYGTSYKRRAVCAMAGLGANLPEDAVYPFAFVDAEGNALTGNENYVLHFAKGQLPPARAFWSITLYADNYQVPNAINRFAIGDRDPLRFNPDGSLDVYVQADSPGEEREANWLPSPRGARFDLTMRIYLPTNELFDGTWVPPRVELVHARASRPSRAAYPSAQRRSLAGRAVRDAKKTARSMRLRTPTIDGRAAALRRLMFIVQDDGSVAVLDDGKVVDRYANLPRALISYGLRRSQLVPVEA